MTYGATAHPAMWSLSGMNTASWCFFALAVLFAIGDWVAVSGYLPRIAHLEYAAKPAVVVALWATAVAVATPDPTRRDWFLVSLVFCLIGDVLLMLPGDHRAAFGGGLGSFLVAHVCLIVGLVSSGGGWTTTVVALAVLVAAELFPARLVFTAVARGSDRFLLGPMVAYMVVLLVMGALAWSAGFGGSPLGTNPLVALGGLFFVLSDSLLAVNRFVRPIPRATLWVHVTYHLALGLLVLSLAGVAASR